MVTTTLRQKNLTYFAFPLQIFAFSPNKMVIRTQRMINVYFTFPANLLIWTQQKVQSVSYLQT